MKNPMKDKAKQRYKQGGGETCRRRGIHVGNLVGVLPVSGLRAAGEGGPPIDFGVQFGV